MSQPKTWKCDVCGYIHEGDAPPATCPVCGVGPELFSAFEAVQPAATAEPAETQAATRWRCLPCGYVHEGDTPPEICPVCGADQSMFRAVEQGDEATAEATGARRIVILGAGVAGVTAADKARASSDGAEITLLSKEDAAPYYRINLTRLLAGEVEEAKLRLKPESWYESKRITRRTGEVTAIDREARQLSLRDGDTLDYDALILASGAHPFIPPIPGASRENVCAVRNLEDARRVLGQARKGARCVCIGGGLLGLETAGALSKQGMQVTVLEGFGWLLPRQLAEPAARLLQVHLEELGIAIRGAAKVEEIVGDEAARGVKLGDGSVVEADLVVLATGVRPNSYLARQIGLEVDKGVIVDDSMGTADPAIYAAGDVAEHRGLVTGLWPTAYGQGAVAGTNAAGGAAVFEGLPPSARIKVLDVDLFSIGEFTPRDGSYRMLEEQQDGRYIRLVCRDGKLLGANLYGDARLARQVQEAVEKGTQLKELPELLAQVPGLAEACDCD